MRLLAVVAHAGPGFQGFELLALALSASPPFVAAAYWLVRRRRRRNNGGAIR